MRPLALRWVVASTVETVFAGTLVSVMDRVQISPTKQCVPDLGLQIVHIVVWRIAFPLAAAMLPAPASTMIPLVVLTLSSPSVNTAVIAFAVILGLAI